jgi:pyridoxal phosphate enzyme (YggS family)
MSQGEKLLRRNLAAVEDRLARACARAGRRRDDVLLVAVVKYVDAAVAQQLYELGVRALGESRPQELWRKAAFLPQADWHLVGHLQRNKVRETLLHAQWIHSVDSLRLLEAIDVEAARLQKRVDILLEFNLAGEASKYGFGTDELGSLLAVLPGRTGVCVRGLMTMTALAATDAEKRATFAKLRHLRERINAELPQADALVHLSMGMSDDFETAVEEGATLVRIGSALFQGLSAKRQ